MPITPKTGSLFHAETHIVRLRHFTNSKGLKGIQQNGVIKASDQNKVFAVRAKGKAPAPRDVEKALGIKKGRGRNHVDFDAKPDEFAIVENPLTKATESVFDGDVNLTERNPTFTKR